MEALQVISDSLPILDKILEQQITTLERLEALIGTFSVEREPIEPTLKVVLQPLTSELETMQDQLNLNQEQAESESTE